MRDVIKKLKYFLFLFILSLVTYVSTAVFYGRAATFPLDLYPTAVAVDLINQGKAGSIYHPKIFLQSYEYKQDWLESAARLKIFQSNISYVYHPFYAYVLSFFFKGSSIYLIQDFIYYGTIFSIVLVSLQLLILYEMRSPAVAFLLAIIFTAIVPTDHCLALGQNSIIALAFALLGLSQLTQKERISFIGLICFLIACAMKPWVILSLFVFFLLKQYRKLLKIAAAYLIVLEVLPYLVLPSEVVAGYWEVRKQLAQIYLGAHNDFSLHASLLRVWVDKPQNVLHFWARGLAVPEAVVILHKICTLMVACLSLLGMFLYKGERAMAISISLAIPLLLLGVAWTHYFVFCLPIIFTHAMRLTRTPIFASIALVFLVRLIWFTIPPYIGEKNTMLFLALPYVLLFSIVVPALFVNWRSFKCAQS